MNGWALILLLWALSRKSTPLPERTQARGGDSEPW